MKKALLLFFVIVGLCGSQVSISSDSCTEEIKSDSDDIFKKHSSKFFAMIRSRRANLGQRIRDDSRVPDEGTVIISAGFDDHKGREYFAPDSNFFYFTGLSEEAGAVVTITKDGESILWLPNYINNKRSDWLHTEWDIRDKANQCKIGMDVRKLGDAAGPEFTYCEPKSTYNGLMSYLQGRRKRHIFRCSGSYAQTVLWRHIRDASQKSVACSNVDSHIASLRRCKSPYEIHCILEAIKFSGLVFSKVVQLIKPKISERGIQACIAGSLIENGSRPAYPTIVAARENLHKLHHNCQGASEVPLQDGDLILIDVGTLSDGYASDLTRTYSVGGIYTDRQSEVYNLVLNTQEYIASLAKPGYCLNNKQCPDRSLTHLARRYLKEQGGYDRYFPHGIGHFLGIDTHDVGDVTKPLQVGDVFTIEPGIYISHEEIGIRIEDDYLMKESGAFCLSDQLPKKLKDIEQMMLTSS